MISFFINKLIPQNKKLAKTKKEDKPKEEKAKAKEGDTVIWKDSKGNHKGVITKMNPKTANITEDNGDSKRI